MPALDQARCALRAALTTLVASAAAGCGAGGRPTTASRSPELPLGLVEDVVLPGRSTRFDYQAIDPVQGHLGVAHVRDD